MFCFLVLRVMQLIRISLRFRLMHRQRCRVLFEVWLKGLAILNVLDVRSCLP